MNKILSLDNINKNDFILKNVLYLKLKKIDSQFYGMNSQYLKSIKLTLFPIKSSYFNFFEKLVITNVEEYNFYDCNYYFGLFSGCHKFYFKILFKDYLSGLKPAKFSLALNQMGIKPDNFIELINLFLDEIISVDFFLNFLTEEEFNDDSINLFNLKLHFLVLLKKKKRAGTKYFIIFKGFFLFQLQTLLYYYFLSDLIFFLIFDNLYEFLTKKRKLKLSVLLNLIIFYIYKLLNYSVFNFLNIRLFYNKTELLESRGNFLVFINNSFYNFCKKLIRFRKNYSFFYNKFVISYIINLNKFFLKDDYETNILSTFVDLKEYNYFLSENYKLVIFE
jgi:hypothetical protein